MCDAVNVVLNWIRNEGPCPSDADLCAAVRDKVAQWHEDRKNGLDVVATAELDELIEIVTAMKDLT